MSQLRVLNTSIFLFFVFIIQETVIARIHFPFNGFSLYIAALMVLLSLEDRAGSLVFGFIGGLVMDLSTSATTPFGQWALAMTFIGYIFSVNRESLGDFIDRPLLFVLFVCASSAISMVIFLLIGVLLVEVVVVVDLLHAIIIVTTNRKLKALNPSLELKI